MASTGYRYASAATSSYWSNASNAIGDSTSSYASYGGSYNATRGITLSGYDFADVPDNAVVTQINVVVRSYVNNTSRGDISGSCTFGNLNISETTTAHDDITTFTGSWTGADIKAFTATVNNKRTNLFSGYTTYLYYIGVDIAYTVPVTGFNMRVNGKQVIGMRIDNRPVTAARINGKDL